MMTIKPATLSCAKKMIEAAPHWGAALSVEEREELLLIKALSKRLSAVTSRLNILGSDAPKHLINEHNQLVNYFNKLGL